MIYGHSYKAGNFSLLNFGLLKFSNNGMLETIANNATLTPTDIAVIGKPNNCKTQGANESNTIPTNMDRQKAATGDTLILNSFNSPLPEK